MRVCAFAQRAELAAFGAADVTEAEAISATMASAMARITRCILPMIGELLLPPELREILHSLGTS